MSELKSELENNKYQNVTTYLNSGNVILESSIDNKETIMKDINKIINDKFNLEIPVFIMTTSELENILNHSPNWWGTDSKEIYDNLIFIIPPTKYEEVYNTIGEPSKNIEKIISSKTHNHWRIIQKRELLARDC